MRVRVFSFGVADSADGLTRFEPWAVMARVWDSGSAEKQSLEGPSVASSCQRAPL
jgi:hypothetical protein